MAVDTQAASAAVKAKAGRLLAEQRVLIGVAGYVAGDHGNYVVAIRGGALHCDCPARVRCAHAEAVARLITKAREM